MRPTPLDRQFDLLFWRLIIGTALAVVVAGLACFDVLAGDPAWLSRPGLVLAPLALVGSVLAGGELVRLFESNAKLTEANRDVPREQALAPSRYVVSSGALVTTLVSFTPLAWSEYPADCVVGRVGWTAIGMAVSVLGAMLIEMARYQAPGVATVRLSQSVFGIVYAGGLMGFVTQLRMLGGEPWGDDGRWGMVALVSLIAVVKGNDIGAYTAGRLFGRSRMTPVLSPGKTWEGFAGGMAMSIGASCVCLGPVGEWITNAAPDRSLTWWAGAVAYGVSVGLAGVAGDLAISLLKRDAGLKNSSSWLPGLGGVLDLLDSVLFGAPVAYLLWAAGVVGP